MKLIAVKRLSIPEVIVITFGRFRDERGYFSEPFRLGDISAHPDLGPLAAHGIRQVNESFSRAGVVRGLHFQWNPYMGKLVRTVAGRMVDIVCDIRKGSPTFGKGLLYDLPERTDDEDEWIWIPPGFAHGNFFTRDTKIEYFCTGEYAPGHEAGLTPFSPDIDWTLAESGLYEEFQRLEAGAILSEKDRGGLSLDAWRTDVRSDNFIYGQCE
ncbi:MAG TPA: dTDP-4-keto-6-deoxy-D-glucose epimerase [Spirochaetia bacterium]|nr:dTDP-4-keto-6-deoxy-D-glucose epimerase [Spirochaetia bacterium]